MLIRRIANLYSDRNSCEMPKSVEHSLEGGDGAFPALAAADADRQSFPITADCQAEDLSIEVDLHARFDDSDRQRSATSHIRTVQRSILSEKKGRKALSFRKGKKGEGIYPSHGLPLGRFIAPLARADGT
jgi:hypothetical protein